MRSLTVLFYFLIDLDFMVRTKTWRTSWKILVEEKGFIEPAEGSTSRFTSDHQLTQAGKDYASTPEYEEFLREMNFQPSSNEEHQERIKKRLLNKAAVQIFDLLTTYGSLTRKELATIIGVNDRSHAFSYGLKDIKNKGLAVENADAGKGKLCLSDVAFLNAAEDRPTPVEVDASVFEKGAKTVEGRMRSSEKNRTKKNGGKDDDDDEVKENSDGPNKKQKTEDVEQE
jgi:hypothetical protein